MRTYSFAFAMALAILSAAPAAAADDVTTGPRKFAFVHTSDTHINTYFTPPDSLEDARSYSAVRTLKNLGPIFLKPFAVTAPAPSFIINTGDICEFGMSGVTSQVVDRYFGDLGLPVYYALGNHDGTWAPPLAWFQERFGRLNYSFDFLGVHFVALTSAGIQDPRPSFGQEAINFLQADLAKVNPATPVILYFHHPLPGNEFASRYDYDRMLDVAEMHNVVLMLDGHGHNAVKGHYDNMDSVMGGSTFSKNNNTDGYNIVSIDGDTLRVAYRRAADPDAKKPLLEKKIPARSLHPEIEMSVAQQGAGDARQVVISAQVKRSSYAIAGVGTWSIDDELTGTMRVSNNATAVSIPADKLEPGVHYARLTFGTSQQGVSYDHSMPFAVEQGTPGKDPVAAWRFQMGGGTRSRPVVDKGRLYVGSNDGSFYALDAATGKLLWQQDAGGPVTAGPAVFNGTVIYGTGNGHLRCVTENGQTRWDFPTGTAVMGHPLVHDGMVYFASMGATVYCLDAAMGQQKWKYDEAKFNVETKPIVVGKTLCFGAWDGDIYCLDLATGKKLWNQPGPRNQTNKVIPQYYAPADADLVALGDRIYATDRAAESGMYSAADGKYLGAGPKSAVAFGPSADGKAIYLRRMGSPVAKLDRDLKVLWEGGPVAGSLPFAPVEAGGVLYGITSTGTMYAVDAATGKQLWKYHVAPSLYVNAPPTIDGSLAYVVSQDGVLTAVKLPELGK